MFLKARTLLITTLISTIAIGQRAIHIKPVEAKGVVIGTLEGMDDIAILQISSADTANADFEIDNKEILCTFRFGTGPTDGDPSLPGIQKNDVIRMELWGRRKHAHEPWDYQVFRYWIVKEKSSSEADVKPQK